MTDDPSPSPTLFETIRHDTDEGAYWLARELATLLDYSDYRNFVRVVNKARLACANSGYAPADHFVDVTAMIATGKGAHRRVADVRLSRYACYLIVENADPAKEIVALGQTYFAIQTQRVENADALARLTEVQRRLYLRGQVAHHNRQLAVTAQEAGVVSARDFAIFQDHGYMGLYAGEGARDIAARKRLRPGQPILDHMGGEELAANLFRVTQTEAKIRREGVQGTEAANQTHYNMGHAVREFIAEQGGTMPEDLRTPAESITQLEASERRRLQAEAGRLAQQQAGQQALFGAGDDEQPED